jgi:hypothetical protein
MIQAVAIAWASGGDPPPGRAGTAIMLFLAVVLLLGLFVTGLLLMIAARRHRMRSLSRRNQPAAAIADPWTESARRLRTDRPRENEDRDHS